MDGLQRCMWLHIRLVAHYRGRHMKEHHVLLVGIPRSIHFPILFNLRSGAGILQHLWQRSSHFGNHCPGHSRTTVDLLDSHR
jgi:hypothetical protein